MCRVLPFYNHKETIVWQKYNQVLLYIDSILDTDDIRQKKMLK